MDYSKAVIVNAAQGKWYPNGQVRLIKSLLYNGWAGDIIAFTDIEVDLSLRDYTSLYEGSINEIHNPKSPYTIKAAALQEVLKLNKYEVIIWLDCSVWAIKNPNGFADMVNKQGYYFWKSGYNLAQTSSDSDLKWIGWDRDYVESMNECASSMFAYKPLSPQGEMFSSLFINAALSGVCSTNREHKHQSYDKRFLFARQDQTAASLIFHKIGYEKMYEPEMYSSYQVDNKLVNESVYFLMRGM